MINKLILVYLTLQIIILVHEFGHYIFARFFNYPITDINIGFGKIIYSLGSRSFIFNVRLFPLGGFISIAHLGENDRWFNATMTYLGGACFNILLAFFCMLIAFQIGIYAQPAKVIKVDQNTDLITMVNNKPVNTWAEVNELALKSFIHQAPLTIQLKNGTINQIDTTNLKNFFEQQWLKTLQLSIWEPTLSPIIKHSKNSLLKTNDIILTVNNKIIKNNQTFKKFVQYNPNNTLPITLKRNGKITTVMVKPQAVNKYGIITLGSLDISLRQQTWPIDALMLQKYNFTDALVESFIFVGTKLSLQFWILIKLLQGQLNFDMLSGPIGIYSTIYQSMDYGIIGYLYTLSLLSIAVAMINLVPIPPTDGFYILIKSIESILFIKIGKRYIILLQHIALILIFLLIVNVSLYEIEKYILALQQEVLTYEI